MEGSLVRSSERRSNREQMVVCKGAIWSIEFQRILDGAGSIVFFSTSSAEWRLSVCDEAKVDAEEPPFCFGLRST